MQKAEMTLKELQLVSLDILKDVHAFCVGHGICYSVAYGTLLGAIRHKGFIPWDDDIDIMMPRQQYDRFCKEYKSDKYKLSSPENNKSHMVAMARVYDDKVTTSVSRIPWCKQEVGVYIDVFPLDGCPDDEQVFRELHDIAEANRWKGIARRKAMASFSNRYSLKYNISLFIKKILFLNGMSARKYTDKVVRFSKMIPYGQTSHWSQLCCLDAYEYYDLGLFSSVSPMPFEDTEVMVLNGYDKVLEECYGDYMQLPPVEERVGHSARVIKFYWK